MTSTVVEDLLQTHRARLWRAREPGGVASSAPPGLPTGHVELDRCLPGGGWPQQGLIEVLTDHCGIGELQLLMPALAALGREQPCGRGGGWLAWISPPHRPYAPSLAAWGIDVARVLVVQGSVATEWAMEQALRSEACSAVLGWASPRQPPQALRRLQLAAEQSRSLAVLFRGLRVASEPSPAVLRLALAGARNGLEVHIVKSRGGRPASVTLLH